ncbi:MAG: NADH-quinone oxidoreductase subunit J [Planctomycetota bacterium]
MPTALLLYIATIVGAAALVLLMPRAGLNLRPIGALLGASALGGAWLVIAGTTDLIPRLTEDNLGMPRAAFAYYYVFSLIAIAAAVRVITHQKPVYSALWFVMVVLASAGLFLTLSAEFMAFAMVIIYGGAILVTYMFVIMLASHGGQGQQEDEEPAYNLYAREPMWASVSGFLLLAVLLTVFFDPVHFDSNREGTMVPNPAAASRDDAEIIENVMPDRALTDETVALASSPDASPDKLSNVEKVGLDLFESHPLAIELAGVILTLSLIGAVVIARMRVPNEDAIARGQSVSSEEAA